MQESGKNADVSDPQLYLEITRGATAFPHRPVYPGHFLIGAGRSCDLRLGGPDMPTVHSILKVEPDGVRIESLVDTPPLCINGEAVQTAEVRPDDTLRIGSIDLVARFQPQAAAETEESTPELPGMSAEELVDALQADLTLVAETERQQAAAVELLLQAAENVGAAPSESTAPTPGPESEFPRIVDLPDEDRQLSTEEAEQLVSVLNRIADDLNEKINRMQEKERTYTVAAEDLLAMQARFSELLERVLSRLGSDEGPQQRASA